MAENEVLDQDTLRELQDVAGDQLPVVLADFLSNGEKHETRLLQAQQEQSWDSVASVAHDIKGGYGYLGAHQLLKACVAVLEAVRGDEESSADMQHLTAELIREFQAVRHVLGNMVNNLSSE